MRNVMDEQLIEVGNRVFQLRKTLGLTQEKLAELADISVQFLVQIEHGQKTMKIGTLRKLCSALSVSADFANKNRPLMILEAKLGAGRTGCGIVTLWILL